jgi:hypothetical protein
MNRRTKIKNTVQVILKMAKYNLRIIFGNRFIWFLIASFAFFAFFAVQTVLRGGSMNEGTIYGLLLFPGILLIFYPSVFGIQSDEDSRMLEILFGIPNYRYKVWLVRLFMVFLLVFVLLILFAVVASFLLTRINPLEVAFQLMFPVMFLGSMAFMFSTLIKNGNGTAVVMVLLGVGLLVLQDALERTQWNIILNPFETPENFNQIIWAGIVTNNRIFLAIGFWVFLLYGLFNLQKREKFI